MFNNWVACVTLAIAFFVIFLCFRAEASVFVLALSWVLYVLWIGL